MPDESNGKETTASSQRPQRIVSLLPSITEILCELGLADQIVGITHECDHPPELIASGTARVVTTSDINPRTMTQAEIHTAVCGSLKNGQSLYGIDKEVLQELRPDIIFTQSLCDVCAVSYPVVLDTCAKLLGGGDGDTNPTCLPSANGLNPKVISMEPTNLRDCLKTFHVAAKALQRPEFLAKAEEITSSIESGLDDIREAVKDRPKPRVAFIEWHEPIFCGGHWIPDMIEIAGGEYVMPVKSGDRSAGIENDDFAELDPDVILIGPCGFSLERTIRDTLSLYGGKRWWRDLRAVREGRVLALDGNSYYARPGPRLLQGSGLMAACIHGKEVTAALDPQLVPFAGYCQIPSSLSQDAYTVKSAADILLATPAISTCALRPHPKCSLFVAWNGIVVLVYDGFSPSLVGAKQRINMFMSDLKEEKFGSKWPKTTLAAFNDAADDLSLAELERLRGVCGEYSKKIASLDIQIDVRSVSVVEYDCRGLEMLRERKDVEFDDAKTQNMEPTSDEEQARVNSVVEEWSDLEAYLPKVNASGSRIGSYREPSNGATCVAFLHPMPDGLRRHLMEFQRVVDEQFPGRYAWLDETSLHCTLRSLDMK